MSDTVAKPAPEQPSKPGFDDACSDPSSDLLDMDRHANALADYIRQYGGRGPFTMGIFGEWGEGKTTLVRFLYHHLSRQADAGAPQDIRFVNFSAWQYNTTEKLWRALILKIARVLYGLEPAGFDPPSAPKPTPRQQGGLLAAMVNFLSRPALEMNRRQTEYERLVEELNNIGFGAISKRPAQLDEEATLSAVIQGAVAVVSTISPLAAGLRSLLGGSVDVTKLVRRETSQAASETVESLPRFQELFKSMLTQAKGEPVYVFIDDLDRCQPDVALDILESIRITLAEAECIFIIAVDERLIAEGLRLRYKELFASEPSRAAFSTKGQEYLEKIIQIRVRVPPRTAEQTQKLISGQFPQWAAAGDMIQTAVGNNPRRLKQYCQRLTFQYMVGAAPFALGLRRAEPVPEREEALQLPPPSEVVDSELVPPSVNLPFLRRRLATLSREQLQDLGLQLGLDTSELPLESADAAVVLISRMRRDVRIPELVAAVNQLFPGLLDADQEADPSNAINLGAVDLGRVQHEDLPFLRRKLATLSREEFQDLGLQLGLDTSELPPGSADAALVLITRMRNAEKIPELVAAVNQLFPGLLDVDEADLPPDAQRDGAHENTPPQDLASPATPPDEALATAPADGEVGPVSSNADEQKR